MEEEEEEGEAGQQASVVSVDLNRKDPVDPLAHEQMFHSAG